MLFTKRRSKIIITTTKTRPESAKSLLGEMDLKCDQWSQLETKASHQPPMLVHSGKILSLKRACFLGGDAEKSGVRDKGIWGRGSDEEKKSQKSSRAEKEQMGT